MSRRRSINLLSGYQSEEATVNISPLVDVVFLLLVFFVLSGTLLREEVIPVKLPKVSETTQTVTNSPTKLITVDAQGRIFLEQSPVTLEAIRSQAVAGNLNNCVIRADETSPAGVLVQLLATVHQSAVRVLPPQENP